MWGILGLRAMGLCWSDVYIAAKHISGYYINGKQEEIL